MNNLINHTHVTTDPSNTESNYAKKFFLVHYCDQIIRELIYLNYNFNIKKRFHNFHLFYNIRLLLEKNGVKQ